VSKLPYSKNTDRNSELLQKSFTLNVVDGDQPHNLINKLYTVTYSPGPPDFIPVWPHSIFHTS